MRARTRVENEHNKCNWTARTSAPISRLCCTLVGILETRGSPLSRIIYSRHKGNVHRARANDDGYFINSDLFKSKHDVLTEKYYDDVWALHIQRKTREVLNARAAKQVSRSNLRFSEGYGKVSTSKMRFSMCFVSAILLFFLIIASEIS